MTVSFDRYSLLIEGRRAVIRSGALHYFRLPAPSLWRDRLFRLKGAGYNAVDLYFNWAYHSPRPGVYDFTGVRDVDRLLAMAEEAGLWVIARPGPYINAELSGGGLPGWLLARQDVVLRNRKPDGAFVWSPAYMDAVAEWWDQIVPRLARCPRVILMQLENEYATLEMEPDYLLALTRMTRAHGVRAPLFHNDLYAAGLYEDVVDIYGFDNYSVTSFDGTHDWRARPDAFAVIDAAEAAFRPFCAHRPLFAAELQAGWFSGRGGPSVADIAAQLGREHLPLTTKSLLAQGATLFNHYLAVGGTNWDHLASTHVETTYDFAAPLSEAGLSTPRLYEAKALNFFLASFNLTATERVETPPVAVDPAETLLAARRGVEDAAGAHWLFLRNFSSQARTVTLDARLAAELKPFECVALPVDALLKSGWTLRRASVEAIWQSPTVLALRGDRPVYLELRAPQALALSEAPGFGLTTSPQDSRLATLTHPPLAPDSLAWARLGGLTLLLLGRDCLDRLWLESDEEAILGPDERFGDGAYGFSADVSSGVPLTRVTPAGEVLPLAAPVLQTPPAPPLLENWTAQSLFPTRHSGHYWMPVADAGADFDANGLFQETCGWLRYDVAAGQTLTEIALSARHLWAAFVGDRCVGAGDAWQDPSQAEETPPLKTMALDPSLIAGPDGVTIWIWVDSLGRPKGYHDDACAPQGLLSLYVNGRDVTDDVALSPGLSPAAASVAPPLTSPAVRFQTTFSLARPTTIVQPLGLSLGRFPAERVNVWLNGMLIAQDWRRFRREQPYVLPEGVLRDDAPNALTLDVLTPEAYAPLDPHWPALGEIQTRALGAFTKWRP